MQGKGTREHVKKNSFTFTKYSHRNYVLSRRAMVPVLQYHGYGMGR